MLSIHRALSFTGINPSPIFLLPRNAQVGDGFGIGLSVFEDLILVGAPGRTGGEGAAYLYSCAALPTPCVKTFEFSLPKVQPSDNFGNAVAIYKDRVILGTYGYQGYQGQATVYDISDIWNAVALATLVAPEGISGDQMGYKVAISDQVVGVTAIGANSGQGCAYIYNLGTDIGLHAIISQPNPLDRDQFGSSIYISGSWVAVGQNNEAAAGMIYLFDCEVSFGCQLIAKLHLGDSLNVGGSLYLTGHLLFVGATDINTGNGMVYLFDCGDLAVGCSQLAGLNANDGLVSTLSGANGLLVIGEQNNNGAFIYDCGDLAVGCSQLAMLSNNQSLFGASAAISTSLIAISSPGKNLNQGGVYIFQVEPVYCGEDESGNALWNETQPSRIQGSSMVSGKCALGYTGSPSRICTQSGLIASWGDVVNPCQEIDSSGLTNNDVIQVIVLSFFLLLVISGFGILGYVYYRKLKPKAAGFQPVVNNAE